MIYRKQSPEEGLKEIVKDFWMVESGPDVPSEVEKIIPDGYPELIFHYGDPYRTNISGQWSDQQRSLLAGQISHYFFLRNTGQKGMFAIKFQPWAVRELLGINMFSIKDRVVAVVGPPFEKLLPIQKVATSKWSFEKKIRETSYLLQAIERKEEQQKKGKQAVKMILESKGEIALATIREKLEISERSLERYFKLCIGLSPKFYSRIIRFSHIFALVNDDLFRWTDIGYLKGFYDQSHFIKNFKEFTGEEPSRYGFDAENMANFFLKK